MKLEQEQREAFLDEACAGDAKLRFSLDTLLSTWCPECRAESEAPQEQINRVGFLTCSQCGRPVAFDTDSVGHGRESELLLEAIKLEGKVRETFLDKACAGDLKLRCRLESRLSTWCPECEAESAAPRVSCVSCVTVVALLLLTPFVFMMLIHNIRIFAVLAVAGAAWAIWSVRRWSRGTRLALMLVVGALVALMMFFSVR